MKQVKVCSEKRSEGNCVFVKEEKSNYEPKESCSVLLTGLTPALSR